MLVIHIISTEDTNDFVGIYEGLDATILINPTSSECKRAIINEQDRIVLIGHGTDWKCICKLRSGDSSNY